MNHSIYLEVDDYVNLFEANLYNGNSVLKQSALSKGLSDLIFMHKMAKLNNHLNLVIITTFIFRFFIISKQLKLQTNHDDRSRYNDALKYYCFSNENNIQVDLSDFIERIRLGLINGGYSKSQLELSHPHLFYSTMNQLNNLQNYVPIHCQTNNHFFHHLQNNTLQTCSSNESSFAINPKATIPSHVTYDSNEPRKRSYTESVNLHNGKVSSDTSNLNDVKTSLYDLSAVLLRSVGEKPNEHLFLMHIILLFLRYGIEIFPSKFKDTNSFYSCIELNNSCNGLRNNIKNTLQTDKDTFLNSTNEFINIYYDDQKLTDILNRLNINAPEDADDEELQLAIYCLSYSHGINVVLIDYENGELTKRLTFKDYRKLEDAFKDTKSAIIVTYTKNDKKVYQMFSQMKIEYDPFESYNVKDKVHF